MATTRQTVKTEIQDPDNAPGVIAYRVGQLEQTVKQGFKDHNDKLDGLINGFATKEEMATVKADVESLKADRKWLVRLVVGAVVFAILALVGLGFKLNK